MYPRLYLIAGIDPGTTTGIAVLNLNGNLIDVFSSKDVGISGAIRYLVGKGRISIIATDVSPAPGFVLKLATRLGSSVSIPSESLKINEKLELTQSYKTEDSHQRDALAAALNTFNKFKNKFQKIESIVAESDMNAGVKDKISDEVKHRVLHGTSINAALSGLDGMGSINRTGGRRVIKEPVVNEGREIKDVGGKEIGGRAIEGKEIKSRDSEDRWIESKEKQIRQLREQNTTLRREIADREKKINGLQKKISEIKRMHKTGLKREKEIKWRDRLIKNKERNIKNIKSRLGDMRDGTCRLRELWKKAAEKKIIPVAVFPDSYSDIVLIKKKLRKTDLENLNKDIARIAFLSYPLNSKCLKEKGIIVGDPKYVKEFMGFLYIDSGDLRKIEESKSKISLDEIVDNYRANRTMA